MAGGHDVWFALPLDVSSFPLSQTLGHLIEPAECFKGLVIEFNIVLNLVGIPLDKLGKELILQWESKGESKKTEIQQILSICITFRGAFGQEGFLFRAYKTAPGRVKLSDGFKKI